MKKIIFVGLIILSSLSLGCDSDSHYGYLGLKAMGLASESGKTISFSYSKVSNYAKSIDMPTSEVTGWIYTYASSHGFTIN